MAKEKKTEETNEPVNTAAEGAGASEETREPAAEAAKDKAPKAAKDAPIKTEASVEVKVMIDAKLKIGAKWYTFTAHKTEKVPASVRDILKVRGILEVI